MIRRIPFSKLNSVLVFTLALIVAGGSFSKTSHACEAFQQDWDAVSVTCIGSVDEAKPGTDAVIAVIFEVDPGYHVAANASQIPDEKKTLTLGTKITPLESSPNVTIGDSVFPQAHEVIVAGDPAMVFENQLVVYLPVAFDSKMSTGDYEINFEVRYQACNDTSCQIPVTTKVGTTIRLVDPSAKISDQTTSPVFDVWFESHPRQAIAAAPEQEYKSKTPPAGPPWVRDFATAQKRALKSGLPIFLYSTKTYCPHCVVMERELLSQPTLKPQYDQVIWLYVYRDFSRDSADRAAERILTRFSLSSWPQHLLINPESLEVIKSTGRTYETFSKATASVNLAPNPSVEAALKMAKIEALISEFEDAPTVKQAIALLQQEDVVAQQAAARFLVTEGQSSHVLPYVIDMLKTPNDPLRYAALDAITASSDDRAMDQVVQIIRSPQETRNQHVLRGHAIRALAETGNAHSIQELAPFASGSPLIATSGQAVRAIEKIAMRNADAVEISIQTLSKSFPPASDTRPRFVVAQAKRIHETLSRLSGRTIEFPKDYNESSRLELIEHWQEEEQHQVSIGMFQ